MSADPDSPEYRAAFKALPETVQSHVLRFPTTCDVVKLAALLESGQATEEMVLGEFVDVRRSFMNVVTSAPMADANRATRRRRASDWRR